MLKGWIIILSLHKHLAPAGGYEPPITGHTAVKPAVFELTATANLIAKLHSARVADVGE